MRGKIKNKKIEQQEKKSRAKYKCPPELEELIWRVNLVSPNTVLPSETEVIEKVKKEYLSKYSVSRISDLGGASFAVMWFEIFDECFKHVDETTKKTLFISHYDELNNKKADNDSELTSIALINSVFCSYKEWREERRNIYKLVNYIAELKAGNSPKDIQLPTLSFTPKVVQRNDVISVIFTDLPAIMSTTNLDRLRACEICNRIFWAENKNSSTESETCRNALRQRRYRLKNKEEVNAKRQEYYRRNKKIKEIKEKKNGTL